ncbi:L-2,3-diaminopropanoate--citrate ligase [Thauera mechernichensis]
MSSRLLQLPPVERRLVEQYFNTYCRETGRGDPRLAPGEAGPADLRSQFEEWRAAGLMPFLLAFDRTGSCLAGALSYFSPIGYHRLAPFALIGGGDVWQPLAEATPLADLIAAALAAARRHPADVAERCRARLQSLMRNSLDHVRRFHQPAPEAPRPPFVAAEQALRFGHIFHVTSKAFEGFGEQDLQSYAPELGASFRLHYFAVTANLIEAQTANGDVPPLDQEAARAAEQWLAGGDYRLLPCHPWQAEYLLGLPEIDALKQNGALVPLGPLGEVVWPTSSVRTVWLPRRNLFLKLSLNIRITNFVRNNPPEQVERALDASRALSLLPQVLESAAFRVLPELASQTLRLPDEALRAACAVVYRQAMPADEAEHVRVLAAVLEEPAEGEGEIPLLVLLRQAAGECVLDEALVRAWWARYLEVTLLPLLRLFSEYGISLEAHLQNAMVAFRDGWPARGYARDMEGTSISRKRFPRLDRIKPDSPALYSEEQAWHRFQYYVVVNHIAHAIACLGRTGLVTEAVLWRDTAARLTASGDPLALQLTAQPTLPAKANLLSSFDQQGERPSWVDIPNPMLQR